jgi:hypothetical protein
LTTEDAHARLEHHIVISGRLVGAADAPHTDSFPVTRDDETRFPLTAPSAFDRRLVRRSIPIGLFAHHWRLCLKSPEIVFVLPQMGHLFPDARFVFVYRPLREIAESMFNKGNRVRRFPVFHQRWSQAEGDSGKVMIPQGIPESWHKRWLESTSFQRCVMHAASYLAAIAAGMHEVAPARCFVYSHDLMRQNPHMVFNRLAQFLEVDPRGFDAAMVDLNPGRPIARLDLDVEYQAIVDALNLHDYHDALTTLGALAKGPGDAVLHEGNNDRLL